MTDLVLGVLIGLTLTCSGIMFGYAAGRFVHRNQAPRGHRPREPTSKPSGPAPPPPPTGRYCLPEIRVDVPAPKCEPPAPPPMPPNRIFRRTLFGLREVKK